MTDEWTRAEKRKAQSEQAKAIMDFVSMLSDKIAKLERENAELRNNGFTVSAMTEQQLKVALKKGEQLEKENAELKNIERMALYSKLSDQLAQAKEIIKDLCGMVRELNKPNVQLTNVDYSLSEAEQFLKEIEK